jgi:nitroreductase
MSAAFFDVALAQRACRRFDPTAPVPDDDVERILSTAVRAPSAENTQPWCFVVVRDHTTRAELDAIWASAWAMGSEHLDPDLDPTLRRDLEDGLGRGGLATAPVVLVVGCDSERVAEVHAASSIYPAVQNVLLGAAALGYGSCLTTGLTTFFVDQLRALVTLPEAIVPMALVYLGRPARPLGPSRRRSLAEVVHRERHGQPW